MKCNWCGRGEGKNYTIDKKTGLAYYYYCQTCVGDFKKNPFKLYPKDKGGLKESQETNSRIITEGDNTYCATCGSILFLEDAEDFESKEQFENVSSICGACKGKGCHFCDNTGHEELYDLLCPKCKRVSDHRKWSNPRSIHWTDSFGEIQCPECEKYSAEDTILIKNRRRVIPKKKEQEGDNE